MPPEIQPEASKKKFPSWYFIVLLVVLVGVATLFFLRNQSAPLVQTEEPSPVKKEYTQAEKLRILSNIAAAIPNEPTTTRAEKLKILESVAKNAPAPTSSSTADKLKILQALAASTGQ